MTPHRTEKNAEFLENWKKKNQVFLISCSFLAEAHTPQILSYLVYISRFFFSPPSISLLLFEFIEESEYKPTIERLEKEFVCCFKEWKT